MNPMKILDFLEDEALEYRDAAFVALDNKRYNLGSTLLSESRLILVLREKIKKMILQEEES